MDEQRGARVDETGAPPDSGRTGHSADDGSNSVRRPRKPAEANVAPSASCATVVGMAVVAALLTALSIALGWYVLAP